MTNYTSSLQEALSEETLILSKPEELAKYLLGTEGFEQSIELLAVVKPGPNDSHGYNKDILTLLNLAKELKFTIHPISSGLNWGYGTSLPPQLHNIVVILDLSSLNQISFTENEQDLGLITLDPGVTQQQLSDYLISIGDEFMVPTTGAGPDCSIVGNAIERGYGITMHTDHFGAVTAIKGYWGSGRKYSSAIYELDGSKEKLVDKTFKWGVGPHLDGLFTQSNLGIVSQMTIRLARKPEHFISFIVQVPDDKDMEKAVPIIRKILRDYEGTVPAVNLMDKRRVLSMFADNPNPGQHKVMSDQDIELLTKKSQTPAWTIMGSICGTKAVSKAVKKEIKVLFSQLSCKQIYSDSPLFPIGNALLAKMPNFMFKLLPLLTVIKKQLDSFELGKKIMLGQPNKMALKLAYWRHQTPDNFSFEDLSPAKDQCGLLWYAPLVPMIPEKMRAFVNHVRSTCPNYNIEPLITFTNLKHDCVDSTIPILFDLSNESAVKDAHDCLKELVTKGIKLGYVPYRLNTDQQQWLLDGSSNFWQCTNDIKSALDPNAIISKARYNPQS